ncbi:MAG: class I SAM-dependent methyltransferase [Chitinophagaceae bacterium]|nr:MAG: class I SAM-dependent methyltransferase [Chitinophagaceae bacterium]
MDAKQAYDFWASLYDSNKNNTRDLEAIAFRDMLGSVNFKLCLEVGCGTGKNTSWLADRALHVTGVDFSVEMLAKAREKISSSNVTLVNADVTKDWSFTSSQFDLVSFSLVLEHIDILGPVFLQAAKVLKPGGYLYIGELHPFKQYTGTRARFDTAEGRQLVDCFNHHITDFTRSAGAAGLKVIDMNEYFDTPDRNEIPRILSILFQKTT